MKTHGAMVIAAALVGWLTLGAAQATAQIPKCGGAKADCGGRAVRPQTGTRICNHEGVRLWVAIAFREGGAWKSRGWYVVGPGVCQLLAQGTVGKVYAYGIRADGGVIRPKGTARRFCINRRTQFYFSPSVCTENAPAGVTRVEFGEVGEVQAGRVIQWISTG